MLGERDGDVLLINAYEDITEQREYHNTLQRAKEELQAANQRLTERDQVRTKFLSIVSHELRTPLAAIKGFVDNMLEGVTGALTQRQTSYLGKMQSSAERLTRLIEQLLDWSKLEMGAARLVLKRVIMALLMQSVSETVQAVASAKRIAIRLQIEEELPTIVADPDKLEQILWNLLGNAIKYTPNHGQVAIDCRRADQEGILITVSDSGCGISPDDLPRVFDQFSGIRSACPSAKGAQLGLYITKSLVSLHGGRIWVESTVGKGSHFHVRLPLKPPEPDQIQTEARAKVAELEG
jgi:signal transduction histidine kinase